MNKKILIALGDVTLTKVLDQALKEKNYNTRTSNDGENVIEEIRNFTPDLILIDLVLPGKDGYEILGEKSLDRFITKIPVIVVSNSGIAIEMNKIPSSPTIKDLIVKTHIDPKEILEKVEKFFVQEGAPEGSGAKSHSANHGKTVLWVEDDKLLGLILSKKIVQSGFTLLKAADSVEAFALLENNIPDVIVLDIILPGMNGIDILQNIRTQEKLKKTPVVMLSNISSQNDIEKAKQLGAQKFIVKAALSLDEIIREIEFVLAKGV
jgi:DNA-binding response OmpR family regulator